MSWLTTIIKHVDYVRGRYEAFAVREAADREAALAVLDEVRRKELKRVRGRSALESAAFLDVDVESDLWAVRDTKKAGAPIVGCIRVTPATQLAEVRESRHEYRLDKLDPVVLARALVFTRLAIRREYRKTAASLVLFRKLYDTALETGGLASFLSCEPGLYAGYLRLGCRPLGAVHQGTGGGFRIPMVHVHHDREHLERVRSPLVRQLARAPEPLPVEGVRWYRGLEASDGPIDPGVAFYSDDGAHDVHAPLTRGLSATGRAEVLQNAMEVECRPDDVVIASGDGGRNMGFVIRGVVQVRTPQRLVAMLGEGELFGEMAVVLDTPRTADVVAAGDQTRVLLLSQSCIDRLSDPADVAVVWRNLARVLGTRVRRANE